MLENILTKAMLDGDVKMLDRLLNDDLFFYDQLGRKICKADDIQAHRSGELKFSEVSVNGRDIALFGDTAIVVAKMHFEGMHQNSPFELELRFFRVWKQFGPDWQIIAANSVLL